MKTGAVAAFEDLTIGELDGEDEAAEVGGGDVEVELVDEGRGLRLGGGRGRVHAAESFEKLDVHALAIEEGGGGILELVAGEVADHGALVVDEFGDVTFVFPEVLEGGEVAFEGEGLGEEDAVDAAGGGAGDRVDEKTGVDGSFGGDRGEAGGALGVSEELAETAIDGLGGGGIGEEGLFGVRAVRGGGFDEVKELLGDAVHVDAEGNAAVEDGAEADFALKVESRRHCGDYLAGGKEMRGEL